jgi:hypothetical protein
MEQAVLEQVVYHYYLRQKALEQGLCFAEKTEKDRVVAPTLQVLPSC